MNALATHYDLMAGTRNRLMDEEDCICPECERPETECTCPDDWEPDTEKEAA